MPKFTLELTYELPVYVHRVIEAETVEAAIAFALESEDWEKAAKDYDSSGPTYVTGAWAGEVEPYTSDGLPIPAEYEYGARNRAATAEPPVNLPADVIEALRNAAGAISSLDHQVGQMRGMFDDGDGTIEGAVEDGDGASAEIDRVLRKYRPDLYAGKIIATFRPQAWVNDYAVDVDPEGPTMFDVTAHVVALGRERALQIKDGDYSSDGLRELATAPAWVRDWSGPFSVSVEDAIAEYFGN